MEVLKLAEHVFEEVIFTVHCEFVPQYRQSPAHPAKVEPLSGVAIRTTDVFVLNCADQVFPQFIPGGLLTTAPEPVPALITVSVAV